MDKKNIYVATIDNDAIALVENYGFGVELDQFCMAENLEGDLLENILKEIDEIISKHPKAHMFLHAPFNELHPGAIDPKALDLAKERYKQIYNVALRYNIKNMVVHSGYLPHVYFKQWHIEKSVEFWKTYMEDKPKDFKIYIENVLEDEPGMMKEMISKIKDPRIKICLDTGHANCMSNISVERWIEVLGQYIGHFHLHNNDGLQDQHNDFFEGTINTKKVLKAIEKNCNKDITITLEAMSNKEVVAILKNKGELNG